MKILQNIEPIDFTYNFAGWSSTFNKMLLALQEAEFATGDSYVDVDTAQAIDGNKIFIAPASFNSGFNSQGDVTIIDGTLTINSANINILTSSRDDGNVRFIGSNGLNLLSSASSLGFNFGFTSPETQNNLVLSFESGSSFFTFANNVTPRVTNSTIVFGNSTWIVPANPTVDSVMRWNPSTNALQWQTKSALVDELASDVIENLTFSEVTLGAELIPVGTIIDIDATAVENWENGGEANALFPGWLFLDGSTISKVTNPEYSLIVDLLNPGFNTATLPDSTGGANVKLIKYAKDAVTTFRLGADRGIRITQNSVEVDEVSLSGGQYVIQARIDGTTIVYDDNNDGALKTGPNIPVYNSGRLTTLPPISPSDAANKSYVDATVVSSLNTGSTISINEAVDGFAYSDSSYSLSLIDRNKTARAWGSKRHPNLNDAEGTNMHFHAFSPISDSIVKFKKAISTRDQYYFVDESDILYAYGDNSNGEISQRDRGTSGNEAQYYIGLTDGAPYNRAVINQLLPAFLPSATVWPASVVAFDSATGSVGDAGATSTDTHLTIKTKDGLDREYVSGNRNNGLVRYFDSNNQAFTRGYYLSIGPNSSGQFGDGTTNGVSLSSGARLWGPTGAGRMLWLNYAILDSERTSLAASLSNATNVENYRRRFNWFKPNVINALGVNTWRAQTGLPNSAVFSQFDRYIKKVVRTSNAHYVIVGSPGDELNNELWSAGNNSGGSFGNGRTDSLNRDFVPMLSQNAQSLGVGAIAAATGSNIFKRANNNPHGFMAFETLVVGTSNLYIVPGDASNTNLSTQFRLFASLDQAVVAFINGGTVGAFTSTSLSTTNFAHRARLKGAYDIAAARTRDDSSADAIMIKVAKTQETSTSALDALTENEIVTNEVLACGRNADNRLAVNSIASNILVPTPTTFALNGLSLPTKILQITLCNHTRASFALDSSGYLWYSGNNATGMAGTGVLTGTNSQWTRSLSLNSFRVLRYFVVDSNTTIDSIGTNSRIFIVLASRNNASQRYLFAGGRNRAGGLGTNVSYDAYTANYLKIAFPEDPLNIVEAAGVALRSFMLCKGTNETTGRLYEAGSGYPIDHFKSERGSQSWDVIPHFRNIDSTII